MTSKLLTTSTRILSGTAYWQGIESSLNILNALRSEPYKAKMPDSYIDTKKVANHAARSVAISFIAALAVLIIAIIQVCIIKSYGLDKLSSGHLFVIGILALGASGIITYERVYLRWFNARNFIKRDYSPSKELKFKSLCAIDERLLNYIIKFLESGISEVEQDQNIVVFSGINPFVGSGQIIPGSVWSIPILRKKNETQKQPGGGEQDTAEVDEEENYVNISIEDFYQNVDLAIKQSNLPNLEKTSYLFVDGFELETDSKILIEPTSTPGFKTIDRPLTIAETQKIGSSQRAYEVYKYIDSDRDYVFSLFLRFNNVGNITFIDSSAFILTGIDRRRFSLISVAQQDSKFYGFLKTLVTFVGLLPGIYLLVALYYLHVFTVQIFNWKLNDWKYKSLAKIQEEYNYGRDITFREFIAEPLYGTGERKAYFGYNIFYWIKSFIGNPTGFIITIGLIIGCVMFIPDSIVRWIVGIIMGMFITVLAITPSSFFLLERELKVSYDFYGTQDMLIYWKSLQNIIFKSTIRLLKEQGVDVSEFEEAVMNIVNNGTMVTAGNISNSQVAVGSNVSQSTNKQSST
jgi:hypothetical protein